MAAPVSPSAKLDLPECIEKFVCSIRQIQSESDGLKQVGSGIIVRLKSATANNMIFTQKDDLEKLIKLIPALSKCCQGSTGELAIDSTWILLTSHSVTDGSPDSLSNLNMSLHCDSGGYTMGDNVKNAISCCGPKSLIGPGNISDPHGALRSHMLSEARDGICSIELGFTICFLNSNFVKTILKKEKGVLPYEIDVASSSPTCAAVFENSVHKIYWENGSITQKLARQSGHRYPTQESGPHQAQAETIKSNMKNFKENMHCQYPEDGAPTPGAVLVNSNGKVVGIHIGKMKKKKKDEVEITGGINIYSVIELLRGRPAPTLALVTMDAGKRIWCNKWKNLLIPFLESQFINGGYALELNLEMALILFENENFRISINDVTEFRTGVMQMMSAITKNFRFFSKDQIKGRPESSKLIEYINKMYDEVCNFLSASQELWIHKVSIIEVFHLAKNMVHFKLADEEKVKQLRESLDGIRTQDPFRENMGINECYFDTTHFMKCIYGIDYSSIPMQYI